MAILKIRDAEGNVQEIPVLKGDKGDAYVLTEADKQEIADLINREQGEVDLSNYFTKDEILQLANNELVSQEYLLDNYLSNIDIENRLTHFEGELRRAFLTEAQVLDLIRANMPTSAEGVDY